MLASNNNNNKKKQKRKKESCRATLYIHLIPRIVCNTIYVPKLDVRNLFTFQSASAAAK